MNSVCSRSSQSSASCPLGFSSRPSKIETLARAAPRWSRRPRRGCPLVSERSEKNTSWRTLSAARSSLIIDQHGGDGQPRTIRQPLRLGLAEQRLAVRLGQRRADRLQVVAGIEPFRDVADALAQRLAVAQEGRAGEHVDLGAGIVDVVFARHLVAGEGQQVGERIAEHGAAAMADVHRPGRIGRDVLDVDRLAVAEVAAAIGGAGRQDVARSRPARASGSSVMLRKPGPATSTCAKPARPRAWPRASRRCRAASCAAGLASTMAALQARSPWVGIRVGSTSTPARSRSAGSAPSALSAASARQCDLRHG